jgi:DNA-nicking Smr family endonuclease
MTKKSDLDNDDLKAWREVTKGIKKTQKKSLAKQTSKKAKTTEKLIDITEDDRGDWQDFIKGKQSFKTDAQPVKKPRKIIQPPKKNIEKSYPNLSFENPHEVDIKTFERLKRGQLSIEARLDLHGHTLAEAEGSFARFISSCFANEKRVVLVITGRGKRTEYKSVIRDELAYWINMSKNRPKIMAVCQAQPKDGGMGAFYLMLRRPQ